MAVHHNLSAGPCPVTWCEVTGPHERHYQILGQWHAESVTAQPRQHVMVQLGIEGWHELEARPALALVLPDARQVDAELDWTAAGQIAAQLVGAVGRFREISG